MMATTEGVSKILEIAHGADGLTPRPGAKMCAAALQDFRESLMDNRLTFDRGAQTTLAIEFALKWLIEEGLRREMGATIAKVEGSGNG